MMLKRLMVLVAGALVLVPLSPAQADQLQDIKKKGELVCGVLGTDEPFSFIQNPASRTIVGYDVDLCNAVAKSLGVKTTLKQLAVSARIPELQQGRVDLLAASLTHNKEREALIDFSLSTFITGQKVMVKKQSGITQLDQLAGKKVVTVKGSTMEQSIKKAVPTAVIVSFDNSPQAFLALQQGKGVAYVNDETSLIDDFSKLGAMAKDYEILPHNLSTERLALGLKKGETAFREQVNKVLRDLEASGEAEKLFTQWFGPATKMKFPSRPFKIETDTLD
ncbi:ABC transporter substrate-binding protein [Stigmatella erecta]|uniref:Amino acid ABC transporter substrate-binding protein, PAAT family n=1 Tax=Stigmatella erecta TaxID=83460 RepID=A0A1I0DL78_9BACT|nr:ABC transporter substrate-binding protein [Stigmatella erecta]SET33106.1 amino acid ABC transporter substrate-binding protein, PAAT family [Stigmatella erecta]